MLMSTFGRLLLAALLAGGTLLFAAPASAAVPPPFMPQARLLTPGALTPERIAADCKTQIAIVRQKADAIVRRRSARTFTSVVEALENAETDLNDNLAAATFLYAVAADPAVRTASEQCNEDASNVITELTARPDLYAALVAARDSHTAKTPAQRKLLSFYLIGAQRSGASLDAAQRKQYLALEQQLTTYATTFAANLANDTSTITITPDQAKVLAPDFTATLKPDANGNLIVPVNESTYEALMTDETDGDVRKAYYVAYQRRGGEANVKLLEQAIVARYAVARLMHYPNWSAYIAADRMAGTPERIATFLQTIDTALLPKARAERAQLAAAKGSEFNQWDVPFYQNQLRKSLYSVDGTVVKQYFPAPHVIDAVLGIYSHMLGITFKPAPELPRWDPAVLAYDVTDTKTGAYRGAFYLDLYPRPGKFNHFENAPLIERRVTPDGVVHPVLNSILGNWPAPAPGKPALLSHDDVVTFFHEFGHNVAALLADNPYASLNNGFRWDFVEAPSQMLENFVWEPQILKQISSNVDTGAPLPDDLIAKIRAARYFDEATFETTQAFYSTADQRYHTLPPPIDTTLVWRTLLPQMTAGVFVDGTFPQAAFGHLMNGYEGQYYGYLWSKVYAQDMFTAFQKGGLENPAVGMRYRMDILAPARLIEPDAEVRAFLGRPMDPRTFYHDIGADGAH